MAVMDDLNAVLRRMPKPPYAARVEMSQTTFDHLKAAARPEGAPLDTGWRPDGWTPPPPIGALFGVPVVLNESLEPGAWRAIDRDGKVMKEGTL